MSETWYYVGDGEFKTDPTARELLARLDWAKREPPRSAYDAAMLAVVGALVDQLDDALLRLERAEAGLRTLDAMRLEGI